MVPSGATAAPLRTERSLKFKSNCAPVAAPPSPTEPISPMPATVVMTLAAIAAAARVEVEVPGTKNEKSLFGLSMDVSSSWSVAAVLADAEGRLAGVSLGWGAAARVRTPRFEATMVGGILFQATRAGAAEADAAVTAVPAADADVELGE